MNPKTLVHRPSDRDWVLHSLIVGLPQQKQKLSVLAIFSDGTKHCLALEVGQAPPCESPIKAINRAVAHHGAPRTITTDRSTHLYSTQLHRWAQKNGVIVMHRTPDGIHNKLSINQFIQNFITDCLSGSDITNQIEVNNAAEAWRVKHRTLPDTSMDTAAPNTDTRPPQGTPQRLVNDNGPDFQSFDS